MKFTKTNFTLKLNNSSSWIVYIAKTYEEAIAIQKFAMTQKEMLDGWYYSIQTAKVLKDCRVPEFFHDRDYWVTVIEHNNGDWNKESKYELYIVE